eukprot:TRINITY_DN26278_c0_g1_i1.p1 TRINITY_DN26278_c0_g1~~TRINITY_DN26278_c0_g1_i1.p1  ORF type:complete len:2477 (+),score=922.91 TRINITY_DN26278_c0_g1_i1:73-7503(+)
MSAVDAASTASGFTTIGTTDTSSKIHKIFAFMKHLEPNSSDLLFSDWMLRIGVLVEVVQPWGLLLNPHIRWTQSWWMCRVPFFFHLASLWDPQLNGIGRYGGFATFWSFVLLLSAVLLGVLYVLKSGAENDKVLALLRAAIHGLSVPLSIPVMQALLAQMVCDGGTLWLFPTEKCWDVTHFLTFFVGLVAYIGIALGSHCMVTTIYDNNPFSRRPAARAHSNLDSLYVLFKVGAPVAFHCLLSRGMVVSYCWIIGVCSFVLAALYCFVMPYFSQWRQRLRVGSLLTLSWASLIGYVLHKDEGSDHLGMDDNAAIVFMLCLPAVWFASYHAACIRVSSACLAEFDNVLSGQVKQTGAGPIPKYLPESDALFSLFSFMRDLEARFIEYDTYDEGSELQQTVTSKCVLEPYVRAVYLPTDVELAARYLMLWHGHFLTRPTGAMLAMGSRIFTKGLLRYQNSVTVRIHFSDFLIRYLDGSAVVVSFLASLERFEPLKASLSDRYTVYRMSAKLKADLGIKDRSYLTALASARRHHRDALEQMLQFWVALCDKQHLNLMSLAVLANQITDRRERARQGFVSVLNQHSQDPMVLRHFANFLLHVMLDEESYMKCKEEMEIFQEQKRNRRTGRSDGGASTIMQSTIAQSRAGGVSKNVSQIVANMENKTSSRNGSRTVQVLQITVRVVFTPLVLLLIANLVLTFLYAFQHNRIVEQMYSTGQVRQLSQYGCMVLQQLRTEVQNELANTGTVTTAGGSQLVLLLKDKLAVIAEGFRAHHNKLTVGSLMVTYAPLQVLFKQPSLLMKSFATLSAYSIKAVGLWSFGNALSTAYAVLVGLDTLQVAASPYTPTLLENMKGPTGDAFNRSAEHLEDESGELLYICNAVALLLFVTALLTVFIIDLTFVWNFNKIAASKMTTLELFTLIPPGTIQMTAGDAREKAAAFDSESDEHKAAYASQQLSSIREETVDEQDPDEDEEEGAKTANMTESQKRQMAMTKEQALKSLEDRDRRHSVVAMALAKGLEEQRLLEEEMERSHVHGRKEDDADMPQQLGKGGQSRVNIDAALANASEAEDGDMTSRDESTMMMKAKEEEVVEETVKETTADKERKITSSLAVVVFSSLVLLLLGVIFTFRALDSSSRLADHLKATQKAIRHTNALSMTVEQQIRRARSFSQFADMHQYALYWSAVHKDVVGQYVLELTRFGLEVDELQHLHEALDAFDRLHEWNKIVMVLVGDYHVLPAADMKDVRGASQHTWSKLDRADPDFLRRYTTSRQRPPPPIPVNSADQIKSVYHYSDCCTTPDGTGMVPDNDLPNSESFTLYIQMINQGERVHKLFTAALNYYTEKSLFLSGAAAAQPYWDEMVQTRQDWMFWHSRLEALHPEFLTAELSALHDELVNATKEFTLGDDQLTAALNTDNLGLANRLDDELVNVLAKFAAKETTGAGRLFDNADNKELEVARFAARLASHTNLLQYFTTGARAERDATYVVFTNWRTAADTAAAQQFARTGMDQWPAITSLSTDEWTVSDSSVNTQFRSALSTIAQPGYDNQADLKARLLEARALSPAFFRLEGELFASAPGRDARIILNTLKEHIARGVVYDDLYTAEIGFMRKSLRQLRNSIVRRSEDDASDTADEAHLQALWSTIWYSIACASVIGVAATSRKIVVILLALMAAAAALTSSMIRSEVDNIDNAYEQLRRMESLSNATRADTERIRELAEEYVQFADPLAFEEYWGFLGSHHKRDTENELVAVATFLDEALDSALNVTGRRPFHGVESQVRDYTRLLDESREAAEKARVLERTALALATTSGSREGTLSMPRELQLHSWNFSAEPTFTDDVLRFVGSQDTALKYSVPQADLFCPDCSSVNGFTKARAVLASEKYESVHRATRDPLQRISEDAIRRWTKHADDVEFELSSLCTATAALGCIAVGLAVCSILLSTAQTLHSASTERGSESTLAQMNKQLFAKMSRKIRIALLFVVVLLVVLYGVVGTGQEKTSGAVKNLNLATSRQWLVARSVVVANNISATPGVVITGTQYEIRALAAEMQRVNDLLYFGDVEGKYSFVANDDQQDVLQFGPQAIRTDAERGIMYTPCQSTTTTTTANSGQASSSTATRTVLEPVNTRYLSMLTKLSAIAYHPDNTAADRANVIQLVQQINLQADELMDGLHESSARFLDTAKAQANSNVLLCTVIVALTVMVIMAEYRFVFLPMISQLAAEEDGTKLMLNMIPAEVRESVPEIAEYFSTGRVSEEEKIKKQLQQSEKLLQNILPPAIARRLKAGESPIADDHKAITVAFCACVGFDDLSRGMSAHSVVNFLNELFTKFDEITERFDLEKIKTIGDIYFMCGGLTEKTASDHGLRVMDAVLHFFEALEEHKTRNNARSLSMKAGINTGPAVAGVIGSTKVAYDLWGDAVNVSSRLCGTGITGKVSINPSTYALVKNYFSFHERYVEAKGKGRLLTYVLDDRTQPTPFTANIAGY